MRDLSFGHEFRDVGSFLRTPASLDKQPQRKQSTKTPTHRSAKKAESWKDKYSVLVDNKLYYRLAATTQNDEPFAPVLIPSPRMKAAAKVFVAAFIDAWDHLPEYDQSRLVAYWNRPFDPAHASEVSNASGPHPMIHIVNGPWTLAYVGCAFLGDLLTIPLGLVLDHPHRLQFEIARVLAMAYRYASRAHWRLIVAMLDEPLERWEKAQRLVTDESRDRKLDELENGYFQEFEKQIAELLVRWGIATQ